MFSGWSVCYAFVHANHSGAGVSWYESAGVKKGVGRLTLTPREAGSLSGLALG
jgi:hypothetical protein